MDDNEQRTGNPRELQIEKRDEEEVNVRHDKNGNCMIRFFERHKEKNASSNSDLTKLAHIAQIHKISIDYCKV